jgi:hypothetical protein
MTYASPTPADIGAALSSALETHVLRVMAGTGARDGTFLPGARIEQATGLTEMVTNAVIADLMGTDHIAAKRMFDAEFAFTLTPSGQARAEDGGQ